MSPNIILTKILILLLYVLKGIAYHSEGVLRRKIVIWSATAIV